LIEAILIGGDHLDTRREAIPAQQFGACRPRPLVHAHHRGAGATIAQLQVDVLVCLQACARRQFLEQQKQILGGVARRGLG